MKLLIIDNFDSFTYNLAQYFGELGVEQEVLRNDSVSVADAIASEPDGVVVSPGPCTPREAGISVDTVRTWAGRLPILGVCLGHQSIAVAYGGRIVPAKTLMHGKTSLISHDGRGVFAGLPDPFEATRYHSLAVAPDSLPGELEVCARTEDGEIMGLRHRELPVHGVQFHPESILTGEGKNLLANFLALAGAA